MTHMVNRKGIRTAHPGPGMAVQLKIVLQPCNTVGMDQRQKTVPSTEEEMEYVHCDDCNF